MHLFFISFVYFFVFSQWISGCINFVRQFWFKLNRFPKKNKWNERMQCNSCEYSMWNGIRVECNNLIIICFDFMQNVWGDTGTCVHILHVSMSNLICSTIRTESNGIERNQPELLLWMLHSITTETDKHWFTNFALNQIALGRMLFYT